jgi:4-amino-4-deoxy-L-arabinose transferase-like glycosyltransferase
MNKRYILIVLGIVIYFANLGGYSIYILDEAKNAACAMEMKAKGEWIIPTFNGQLRTDKPPLHYYCMMLAYSIFGVTPFAARFFSALAGILLILVVFQVVKKVINESVALYTVLILLSSLQLAIQFHMAVPDPYLILWITICLFAFFITLHHQPQAVWVMYGAAGLAFMSKGPVGIVLPGLVALVYLILSRQLTLLTVRRLKLLAGIFLFSCIALPWYVAVGYATDGAWLHGFFIEHNFERYTSTMEGHRAFPLAPFVILLVALLPFSVFSIQAIALARSKAKEVPMLTFSLVVVLVFGLFFSFSKTLLPSYPAPALPFLAIVLGYFLHHMVSIRHERKLSINISLFINVVLCAAIPVVVYIALSKEYALADLKFLAWLFIVLPVGSLFGWYCYQQGKMKLLIYSWAGTWMIICVLFFSVVCPKIDSRNPVSKSLAEIKRTGRKIIGYKIFNPAYVFALREIIPVYHSPEDVLSKSKDEDILVLTRSNYVKDIEADSALRVVFQQKDLFERSETVILAN